MEIKFVPLPMTIVPGTTTFPAGQTFYVGPTLPTPNVCPGCGHCKDCGHPLAAPPAPLPPYIWPGSPLTPMSGSVTCAPFTESVIS